ncbi:hypothetical protein ACO2Q2_09715 [Dyella sp. KRB-257]|uniref:hypothetical protein n=1 Tax=Dyella sp. KRB-257 TaxID=3400915 RepID=UPI003BFBC68F
MDDFELRLDGEQLQTVLDALRIASRYDEHVFAQRARDLYDELRLVWLDRQSAELQPLDDDSERS